MGSKVFKVYKLGHTSLKTLKLFHHSLDGFAWPSQQKPAANAVVGFSIRSPFLGKQFAILCCHTF